MASTVNSYIGERVFEHAAMFARRAACAYFPIGRAHGERGLVKREPDSEDDFLWHRKSYRTYCMQGSDAKRIFRNVPESHDSLHPQDELGFYNSAKIGPVRMHELHLVYDWKAGIVMLLQQGKRKSIVKWQCRREAFLSRQQESSFLNQGQGGT